MWWGRRESNPHGLATGGFSYQLRLSPPGMFRPVWGLDYPFTLPAAMLRV
jgi:hypothetical protein